MCTCRPLHEFVSTDPEGTRYVWCSVAIDSHTHTAVFSCIWILFPKHVSARVRVQCIIISAVYIEQEKIAVHGTEAPSSTAMLEITCSIGAVWEISGQLALLALCPQRKFITSDNSSVTLDLLTSFSQHVNYPQLVRPWQPMIKRPKLQIFVFSEHCLHCSLNAHPLIHCKAKASFNTHTVP